jgi:hypothetical protein
VRRESTRLYVVGMSEALGGQTACDEIVGLLAEVVQFRSLGECTEPRYVIDKAWASLPRETQQQHLQRSLKDLFDSLLLSLCSRAPLPPVPRSTWSNNLCLRHC